MKYLHTLYLIILVLLVSMNGMAQTDSIRKKQAVSVYLKQSIAPLAFIGTGLFVKLNHTIDHSVQEHVTQQYPDFHTNADDYIQFAAFPIVYGFDWAGVKAQTDIVNRTVILLKAELLMRATIYTMKYTSHVERPDGSNDYSFPSSHTAQAFMGAVFIQHELGKKSILFPIAGYTLAASVGALRILNNEHWTSDVLVGAGIGMLSMKLAYWTHQYKWNKNLSVLPSFNGKGMGMYVKYTF